MKIKQGYTLSQFVDLIHKDVNVNNKHSSLLIYRYNDFLKQPLTNEIFFVPKVITTIMDRSKIVAEIIKEAENKVIFKGKKYAHNINCIEYEHTENVSIFYYPNDHEKILIYVNDKGTYLSEIKTLGQLFEATNGELELQNVEI